MSVELVFPEDVGEAALRCGHNISDVEKWVSIAAGAGLALYGLSRRNRSSWMVAGLGGLLLRRGITKHCDVYEAFGWNTAVGPDDSRAALASARGINVLESVTINRSLEELYPFWRNVENLPLVMRHLESVERITETISRWRARGPAGVRVEWDAEIYNEIANKLIAWRSLEGAGIVSAGRVTFDRGAGGTRVTVHLQYSQPPGKVGAGVARFLGGDTETEIREDLRRLKYTIEATPQA
jgi:uncharacterized membrane protein